MPDIATALQSVLTKWEPAPAPAPAPAPTSLFKVTNNVTRATFEAIRDNPGITATALHDLMVGKGYNKASISSLVAQMLKQARISRDEYNRLWPLQDEYEPLKSGKQMRKDRKKAEDYARRIATRKANALKRQQEAAEPATPVAPVAPAAPATPNASVDDILNTLSVLQARALYMRLKELFA